MIGKIKTFLFFFLKKRKDPALRSWPPRAGVAVGRRALCRVPDLTQAGRSRAAGTAHGQIPQHICVPPSSNDCWLGVREAGLEVQSLQHPLLCNNSTLTFKAALDVEKKPVIILPQAPPANKAPPTWESKMRCFLQDSETANQGSTCALKLVPS